MKISASCSPGLEPILSRELKYYGINDQQRKAGRINFTTDDIKIAELLVNVRTADNLFAIFGEFSVTNFDELFDAVYELPWESILKRNDKLVVEKVRIQDSVLQSQSTIQAMVQKAAYTKLCSYYNLQRMPETGAVINARIHIFKNTCTVELDLCGMPLSKRGYRKYPGLAPLKETLAAASLFNAGWKASNPLFDMFCGTGSIAIEAALYALHRAPGLKRNFVWEQFARYDGKSLQEAKQKAQEQVRTQSEFYITASDIDPAMIQQAKHNARYAEVPLSETPNKPGIFFTVANFSDVKPLSNHGFVITDPPYGNRISTQQDTENLYTQLKEHFSSHYNGFDISSFCDREDFVTLMALQHARRLKITDGKETRWLIRWMQ